jgi:hypothetical protein
MLRLVVLAVAVVGAVGCQPRLYHYHRTVIGLDIAGNVTGQSPSGHLTLGYSRRLVAVVPKEMNDKSDDVLLPSTVFCTQVKASLGGANSFREILGTGEPADEFATLIANMPGAEDIRQRNLICPGLPIPEDRREVEQKRQLEEEKAKLTDAEEKRKRTKDEKP